MDTFKNFEDCWKRWNVYQTPKIDFYALARDGKWGVMDVNVSGPQTLAKKGDVYIRVKYIGKTGGVKEISVRKGDSVIWSKTYSFVLKPTVDDIIKILTIAGVDDPRKYYTAV